MKSSPIYLIEDSYIYLIEDSYMYLVLEYVDVNDYTEDRIRDKLNCIF